MSVGAVLLPSIEALQNTVALVAGLYTGCWGVGVLGCWGRGLIQMIFMGRKKELFPIGKGSQALPPALSSEGARLRQNVVCKVQDHQCKALGVLRSCQILSS